MEVRRSFVVAAGAVCAYGRRSQEAPGRGGNGRLYSRRNSWLRKEKVFKNNMPCRPPFIPCRHCSSLSLPTVPPPATSSVGPARTVCGGGVVVGVVLRGVVPTSARHRAAPPPPGGVTPPVRSHGARLPACSEVLTANMRFATATRATPALEWGTVTRRGGGGGGGGACCAKPPPLNGPRPATHRYNGACTARPPSQRRHVAIHVRPTAPYAYAVGTAARWGASRRPPPPYSTSPTPASPQPAPPPMNRQQPPAPSGSVRVAHQCRTPSPMSPPESIINRQEWNNGVAPNARLTAVRNQPVSPP